MNIAVAGYGVEGRESVEYYLRQGSHLITVLDENKAIHDVPKDVQVRLGEDAYKDLGGYDLVVRTAGLPPRKVHDARTTWSATNEFFLQCPASIIGVTGTKGKGTTSSFIASILRAAGKTVHLVGNIGVPALQVLPHIKKSDVVVYELSSFQLWDIKRSPQVGVVLMIEPDHQDIHASFDEYIEAKANIVRFQSKTNTCVYNGKDTTAQYIGVTQAPGKTVAYVGEGSVVERLCDAQGQEFLHYKGKRVCPVSAVLLPGPHNIDNASAAIAAVYALDEGISTTAIEQGLRDFKGLDHRLKYIATKHGVKYYDDSIATTPGSAIAALRAFTDPKVMILGGSSKGADFEELALTMAKSSVRHVIVIGQEAPRIVAQLDAHAPNIQYTMLGAATMREIVASVRAVAEPGDVAILSPACASFGMFKNYKDRGERFIKAVQAIQE